MSAPFKPSNPKAPGVWHWLGQPLPVDQTNSDATRTASQLQMLTGLVTLCALVLLIIFDIEFFLALARHSIWHALAAQLPFALSFASIIIARSSRQLRLILLSVAAAIICSLILDGISHSDVGNIPLYVLVAAVTYRLPARWFILLTAIGAVALIFTNGLDTLLGFSFTSDSPTFIWPTILTCAFVISITGTVRMRYLLIQQLRETQQRLHVEMERTAEFATARERARIARDIHDVLAHSLTVLSVQVQAARTIVRDQPERAAAMLDEMGKMLKESQAESRHVIGLLREVDPGQAETGAIGVRLHALSETFAERTGVRSAFHEIGIPRPVSAEVVATLRYALLEALTNAYRHGAARHTWAELRWQDVGITLSVRDDGLGKHTKNSGIGSGNGLRGMHERVTALGGALYIAPQEEGGFVVEISLPLEESRVRISNASGAA